MRIVIDMQGAQTESRFRGIGRYTMSLTQAIVKNRGNHEIILALSGLFPDTIEYIRSVFDDFLPQKNIRVWYATGPTFEADTNNANRGRAAELIRESFLESLQADCILITSLFEGFGDDAVVSIGRYKRPTPTAVILYDLIPLLSPDEHFQNSHVHKSYYSRKIDSLKKSTLLLAISESSRQEALSALDFDNDKVVNISGACDSTFRVLDLTSEERFEVCNKLGISRPFILYTGGADDRKNLYRLIKAYSRLPKGVRSSHHLLLAGKMPPEAVQSYKAAVLKNGLKTDDVLFSGYVSDEDLIYLYNLCQAFVFPSLHEGLGLPPLEAMACGAPTIAANVTSLPEVVGLQDALFDPESTNSIRDAILTVLTDTEFRERLRAHAKTQVKLFSWDGSAHRAIEAIEQFCVPISTSPDTRIFKTSPNDLLVDSIVKYLPREDPLKLMREAINIAKNAAAGVERQLMLDISELYQKDSATGVQRVVKSYLNELLRSPPKGYRVEPVYATPDQGYKYAREFSQKFIGVDVSASDGAPIEWQRGDIFFCLDMQHHVQLAHQNFFKKIRSEGVIIKFLVHDLLPIQLADLFRDPCAKELHERWLSMIASMDQAICVSKATADAFGSWIQENGIFESPNFQISWVHNGGDIKPGGYTIGVPSIGKSVLSQIEKRTTFLCVATLEPRKRQEQILSAFELLWKQGKDINLVFVGNQGWGTESLVERIRDHNEQDERLFWLKGISDEHLREIYSASNCLIAASLDEGFGLPVVEAAQHNVPVIARDIPVFREVAGESAYYFTGNSPHDLAESITSWLKLYVAGKHPKTNGLKWSTWKDSSKKLVDQLTKHNCPRKQLFVDISELVCRDARSGIQRVVRSILKEWLLNPPNEYRIEAVYATPNQSYRYARKFVQNFLHLGEDGLEDSYIDYSPGDIFFGLDFQPQIVSIHEDYYQKLRRDGVRIVFLVYDLLPIQMPKYLGIDSSLFSRWLEVVAHNDQAVCISKSVADDLVEWVSSQAYRKYRSCKVDWFHIAADIVNSVPTQGLPENACSFLSELAERNTFLMVGTLEPRKAHAVVLDAFEYLWASNMDVNLVIVGKQGWLVDDLVERIENHSQAGKHFFWLKDISDEYLEKIYAASSCLIAASYGEGFGLPLIEAAQHRLPVIARDIKVFREVAGNHAYYFDADSPEELAFSIRDWLKCYEENLHPSSEGMFWLNWRESAQKLMNIVLDEKPLNFERHDRGLNFKSRKPIGEYQS